jgi:hypothetical protein
MTVADDDGARPLAGLFRDRPYARLRNTASGYWAPLSKRLSAPNSGVRSLGGTRRSVSNAAAAGVSDRRKLLWRRAAARLEAAAEVGDRCGKVLEANEMIAARDAGTAETAVPQHRHAEDRVVAGCDFRGRRGRDLKTEPRVRAVAQTPPRGGDIAGIDVDALDGGKRKIASQRKHFFAGRAAE